jgi:alpha-1,4-N-acetylglucosaminyltransferase EXTL3
MPFKLFPSTPFDPFVPNNVKYSLRADNVLYSTDKTITLNESGGSSGKDFLRKGLGGNYDDEQFTIVILAYKRETMLSLAIDNYLKLPDLFKIIVIWNDLEVRPTDAFLFRHKDAVDKNKLVFIQGAENRIDNRFLPYKQIQTDCVLVVDDDVLPRLDMITFGFRIWRENRHRLVGFISRYHTWDIKNQTFVYRKKKPCEYSLISSNSVFYHRFYNYLYTHVIDARLRHLVQSTKNCDDFVLNYMVAAYTRQPPIKVSLPTNLDCGLCKELTGTHAPLWNTTNYAETRDKCLNTINLVYGYNPLLYSQTRVDSLRFQTREDDYCFKHV